MQKMLAAERAALARDKLEMDFRSPYIYIVVFLEHNNISGQNGTIRVGRVGATLCCLDV